MKKTIILLTAMAAVLTACQKENPDVQNAVQKETAEAVDVAPLSFSSAAALQNTLYSICDTQNKGAYTKSLLPDSTLGFISYAETVMQEDDYDARPNSICSEVIGSVLNPDGEVVFGDYMMK